MLDSETTLVVGRRGSGKSLWARLAAHAAPRLFVYAPVGEYENVQYTTDEHLVSLLETGALELGKNFRYGVSQPDEVEGMGVVAYKATHTLLVLEEFFMLYSRGENLPPWINLYVFLGRHRSLDAIVISQRASNVPIALRSQTTRVVSFTQSEPDDLQWLRNSGHFSSEQIEQIPTLQKGECLDSWRGSVDRYNIRDDVAKRLGVTLTDTRTLI